MGRHTRSRTVLLGSRLGLFLALLLLNACGRPIISGLGPQYPPAWSTVDSLRPTLKWESFPTERDTKKGTRDSVQGLSHVTYDLKIWRVDDDWPIRRVAPNGDLLAPAPEYTRTGLQEPHHMIETPLQANSQYFWTVRARFLLQGSPRVTQSSEVITIEYLEKPGLIRVQYHGFFTPAE
jgi:hypothetical protein